MNRRVAFIGALVLAGAAQPASATAYVLPGNLPWGCSIVSSGNYSCVAGVTLASGDTVTIGSPKPATLTINGDLRTANAQINTAGSAAELTLVVTGALRLANAASLVANVTAGSVNDVNGNASIGGSLASTTGSIRLRFRTDVAGSISSTSGAIKLDQENSVGGNVTSTSGAIEIGLRSPIGGSVSTSGQITLGQEATVAGSITGSTEDIDIGYAAQVTGAITSSSGKITFAQNSVALACVKSTASATITLGRQAALNSVCCGSSTCNNSCVNTYQGAAKPPLCPNASSLHHIELQGSASGVTCSPSTLTVRACQNAACTTPFTGGVSGTLVAAGSGMTVNWPSGAGFAIAAGASSTTESVQVTSVGAVVLGVGGVSPTPGSATVCNFGSPLCTFTAADSGFVFAVGNHVADVAQTAIGVRALRKSDSSALCVPAFASVSKPVTFSCAYLNPDSGSQPVRVNGSPLNAGNNMAAACDAGGRALSLAFDASGAAAIAVQYADVGLVQLNATYVGASGSSEAGLVMRGSDSFITAPYDFAVGNLPSVNITAGTPFGATVTARNYNGATTPNFGRESAPEGVTLSFVRTQPSGAGAGNGGYSGTLGGFSNGTASSSNLVWSEVGRGDVAALLSSGSYLGSGQNAAGSSGGRSGVCALEGGTCTLPTDATAFVAYGANGAQATRSNVTGSIGCNNGVFGDPLVGTVKACSYFVTGGAWPGQAGAAGRFVPHHFDILVNPACGSFSYAAQPFTVTLSAINGLATPGVTANYDGSPATTPNFARAVTLSDAPALGVGNFGSSGAVAAALFSAGIATTLTPAYSFTSKLTAAQTLTVRAIDADAVSSAGYAEGSTGLRSGRLRLLTAFGSEKTPLPMAVQAQYWGGQAWVPNVADACTSVPAAAVVLSGYLNNRGAATSGWTTSASAVTLSNGTGTLTLAAPSGASTGSVDVALNLGSSGTDQSCLVAHPASLGAALPWLRSQQGSCSPLWDRDPAARASFGIYAPETRKTLYGREIF